MADEVTLDATLNYADSESADETLSVAALLASVATKKYTKAKQSIGTSEEAINLGEVTAPGWALFVNRAIANFIELRVGSGGAKFAKLKPGEFAFLRLGSGAQVPFAISDTAASQLEYFVAMT